MTTHLLRCRHGGSSELLSLLLSRDADMNARDSGGETPLWVAAEAGAEEDIREMLKTGNVRWKRWKYARTYVVQ